MKAKPDLTPDCDVHGEPMYKTECWAPALGMEKQTDVTIWSCSHRGCQRYFHGKVGYRNLDGPKNAGSPTPQCSHEGAYLVVQRALGVHICPVAGCAEKRPWQVPEALAASTSAA